MLFWFSLLIYVLFSYSISTRVVYIFPIMRYMKIVDGAYAPVGYSTRIYVLSIFFTVSNVSVCALYYYRFSQHCNDSSHPPFESLVILSLFSAKITMCFLQLSEEINYQDHPRVFEETVVA